ncbi:MAG: ABC transporter ATP-binding protein, partial [Bacilli bacterium]
MNVKDIINKLYRTHWRLLVSIIILSVFSIAVRIASPLFLKNMIGYIQYPNEKQLIIWGSIFTIGIFLSFVFTSQSNGKISKFGNFLTQAISREAYSSYLRSEILDANKYQGKDVIRRLLHHTNEIGNKHYSKNMMGFFYQGILFLSLGITLLVLNPWFGLLAIASLPLYYFASKTMMLMIKKREEKVTIYSKAIFTMIEDSTLHLKSIKVLNGIAEEELRHQALISEYGKAQRQLEHLKYLSDRNLSTLLSSVVMVTMVTVGGYFAIRGEGQFSLGIIIASVMLLAELYPSFKYVMERLTNPSKMKTIISEVDEILNLKPENRADTVQQLDEIYNLKCKEVGFDYGSNSRFSLDDINFELKKGERLGILGLSNSGKSTLTDLLLKVIRPKQGAILVNNCDINKVNTYYLRDLITSVPHNYPLLRGTFEQNITYPLPFDEYKYNDALNRCRLKSLINSLDQRDQTLIHDASPLITASDKQKIGIANALYKDSKIYVFDDATSKMTPELEKEIIEEIYRLKNKIIILISNRIYNLLKCDKILILNNGRIVEYGKTSELLDNNKSTFARLIGEQSVQR